MSKKEGEAYYISTYSTINVGVKKMNADFDIFFLACEGNFDGRSRSWDDAEMNISGIVVSGCGFVRVVGQVVSFWVIEDVEFFHPHEGVEVESVVHCWN